MVRAFDARAAVNLDWADLKPLPCSVDRRPEPLEQQVAQPAAEVRPHLREPAGGAVGERSGMNGEVGFGRSHSTIFRASSPLDGAKVPSVGCPASRPGRLATRAVILTTLDER